jgi:signal transduction histidine kinase/DNA-binding LacI/PurR family transcriptional regulator/DNA-binding response OmpR family regulator
MAHLTRDRRPTIGVLAGWQFYRTATNLSYLKPVFNGINQAAHDLGCNVFFGCGMGASASPADPIRPAWPVAAPDVDYVPIGPSNTDGLIIFNPLHSDDRSQYMQDLIAAKHPLLFIGSGETGPTIAADNTGGIFEAVSHLVHHGHQRIAFLAGSADDMQGDSGDRLRAYQSALASYGLADDPQIVAYGRHVYDGGYAAIRQIMESGAPFSAILASNDEMALGAMQALKEAGLKIPQDVAVIGFDNRFEGAEHEPSLSSIQVPLFSMGYRSVKILLEQIESGEDLPSSTQVKTRLIVRASCGCSKEEHFTDLYQPATLLAGTNLTPLVQAMAAAVLSQTQSFAIDECQSFCQQLADTFFTSVKHRDPSIFQTTLKAVLDRSASGENELNVWQDVMTLLRKAHANQTVAATEGLWGKDLLDQARQTISVHMQKQHWKFATDQRWTSSRLSLLTADLMAVLDEEQIHRILAQHLPDMGIEQGMTVLFEAEDGDPVGWSSVRNLIHPDQPPIRFSTKDFPPENIFDSEEPLTLALIPLVAQSGQLGFAVFSTEHFDLYGAIVQQIGGALNAARLYRQAMEGQRMAEEANRMKSRFLSTISHELRLPVNLILGLSEMVLKESDARDLSLPQSTRKDVERIHAYSQHLGGLIGDVIDLATNDAGQLRLNNEFVNLAKTLRIVAESGRQLAADKGLEWEALMPESGPWVWGDITRIRQIALNLINNAVKFTEQGYVKLRVEDQGDAVTVSVLDTGLGISPNEQEVIFNEFHQSERSVSRGYGGLGLGLAICKRLVEKQGGEIGVYSSDEEGGGSTFYFRLPTVTSNLYLEQTGEIPTTAQNVLVLTDQMSMSERLCGHLIERGVTVRIEPMHELEMLKAEFEASLPDAILLDISIHSDPGRAALKIIRANEKMKEIPVLFYTSTQIGEDSQEFDYLTKPVEISELTQALDQQWQASAPLSTTRTILVVDDEPNTLELHARIVQSHSPNHRILTARNGREALEILQREIVDLLLLDLQMPGMDGFDVLKRMREKESTRKIPVIIVTGKILTEADMVQLNQGVTAVLGKGLFNIDETVAHIQAALERKQRLGGEAQRLIRSAMAYLHEHFTEPITRSDLARHVGITEDYLTFCFRQELGTTPIEYLQRYRVNQAKRLLKDSQDTITKIAMDVGFSDSGYFSRIFRRETGMSPEVFRRT